MEGPSDGFKWFGEGFDGFPKILPDDCVQYTLYIINKGLNDFEVREQLREVQAATTSLCKSLLNGFIWQRDDLRLELKQENGLIFLQGRTNFGDSVEDEWLIVYLLRALSEQFPQVWVRVVDFDGEFLLVEAADTLPRWLNPEVAQNRVWVNTGRLLIIPKEREQAKAREGGLKLDDALRFIQDRESDLLHTRAIESEAFHRLQKYPAHIKGNLHHAIITIPRRLAYILHEKAACISPAVEAFYLRDPIALKPLQSQGSPRLSFPPDDFVTVSAKFTKVGFAQLKGQDFGTPQAWTTFISKNPDILGQKGYDIGMKITCGFEMLLSDPHNIDKKPVREIILLLEDLDAGEVRLPSDRDVSHWERKEDDESWLDINFEDFERELSGRADPNPLAKSAGFGDKSAQDNLRKMVSRFEKFLNDDEGGAQDAEYLDDMDQDDDSDNVDESGSDGSKDEDIEKDVQFDEDRFASMMKKMIGLPTVVATGGSIHPHSKANFGTPEIEHINEDNEIRKVMQNMEAELREAGALSLEHPPTDETHSKQLLLSKNKSTGNTALPQSSWAHEASQEQSPPDDDDDDEVNINVDRAEELLNRLSEA
ncbi:MAG: hypothetical protein Q9166_006390 [cf. Caloplaca sp. 2 TL-2023]